MEPTDSSLPATGRSRVTLLLVLVLVAAWLRPWTEAATATGVRLESGPWRTGAVAGAVLLALAGLAITGLAASSRVGLRRGVAVTDAFVAAFAAALLAAGHDWLPGGAARSVVAPVFVPLALLAVLDALRPARAVCLVRGGAALLVALLLAVSGARLPAGVATWLALSPLLMGATRDRLAPRRALSALQLVLATCAFFAPHLNAALLGFEDSGIVFDGRYLWQVVSLVLMVLALVGLAGRESAPSA